jgi:aldose 1-epimerase
MTQAVRAVAGTILAMTMTFGGFSLVSQAQKTISVNGMDSVTLSRKPAANATKPEFTSVTVFPGRALLIQQVTAFFPGKGAVDVLSSPSLEDSARMLNDQDTPNGNLAYSLGAAFLYPYPNRIRGPLSADGKTLTTTWNGKTITVPANNIGKKPGAERHAMHGLILKSKVEDLKITHTAQGGKITGVIHGGNFNGHWLSKSDLMMTISLSADSLDVSITAKNVGNEAEPVGIAWHPYFNFPSGDRKQVRVRIPASEQAAVDNYDNVFPTGKLVPVAGTAYDFQAKDGKALGNQFLDDNFSKFSVKPSPVTPLTVTITDPAAKYGIKVEGLSPNIKSIQTYAPPAKNFIAVEHQFNFGDPFGKEWHGMDTGMVTLEPGKSVDWHVRLKVFVP